MDRQEIRNICDLIEIAIENSGTINYPKIRHLISFCPEEVVREMNVRQEQKADDAAKKAAAEARSRFERF